MWLSVTICSEAIYKTGVLKEFCTPSKTLSTSKCDSTAKYLAFANTIVGFVIVLLLEGCSEKITSADSILLSYVLLHGKFTLMNLQSFLCTSEVERF